MTKSLVTEEIREQAAIICAIAASTRGLRLGYAMIRDEIDASMEAHDLACAAWNYVWDAVYVDDLACAAWNYVWDAVYVDGPAIGGTEEAFVCYAEAEALIRSGWSP